MRTRRRDTGTSATLHTNTQLNGALRPGFVPAEPLDSVCFFRAGNAKTHPNPQTNPQTTLRRKFNSEWARRCNVENAISKRRDIKPPPLGTIAYRRARLAPRPVSVAAFDSRYMHG